MASAACRLRSAPGPRTVKYGLSGLAAGINPAILASAERRSPSGRGRDRRCDNAPGRPVVRHGIAAVRLLSCRSMKAEILVADQFVAHRNKRAGSLLLYPITDSISQFPQLAHSLLRQSGCDLHVRTVAARGEPAVVVKRLEGFVVHAPGRKETPGRWRSGNLTPRGRRFPSLLLAHRKAGFGDHFAVLGDAAAAT